VLDSREVGPLKICCPMSHHLEFSFLVNGAVWLSNGANSLTSSIDYLSLMVSKVGGICDPFSCVNLRAKPAGANSIIRPRDRRVESGSTPKFFDIPLMVLGAFATRVCLLTLPL